MDAVAIIFMAGAHKSVVPSINLIPKDPFFDTLPGKLMIWATQIGRYIIVFTELIVIFSFASRFKLDRDLTDLTARVTQKKAVVESYREVETQTRLVQRKLELTQSLLDESKAIDHVNLLTPRIPPAVSLTQLTYGESKILLLGDAANSNAFGQLVLSLQQEPAFKSLSVDRVSSGESGDIGISFSLTIQLHEEEKAVETTETTPSTSTPITEKGEF